MNTSDFRERDTDLTLVLATTVFVGSLALFIRFEEQDLGATLTGVNLGRQRGGIRELQRHIALPFRFERGHVDDDAATGIGTLAQTDREHTARNTEVFDGAGQRKGVRWNDADIRLDLDKGLRVKLLGVHHRAVDIGEYLEFAGTTDVIPVA